MNFDGITSRMLMPRGTGILAVFLAVITASGLVTLGWNEVTDPTGAFSLADTRWAVFVPSTLLLALAMAILYFGVSALTAGREYRDR